MLFRIWALAKNSFREELRRKILYVFLFASIVIILSSRFFNFLAPSQESKIIIDMGLAAILFFGMLIAIFSCGQMIPAEIERKTIIAIFSKPVRKFEFILGKFLGGVLVVALNFFLMSLVFLVTLYIKDRAVSWQLIKVLYLSFWELMVLSSIAVCISTLSASLAFNVTVTFFLYVFGHLTDYFIHIVRQIDNKFVSITLSVIYTVLPNFNNFNLRDKITEGFYIPALMVANISLYALVYVAAMLVLSYQFFRDREF